MQNKKQNIEHIVIIGGGPAGLSAAIYAARARLNPLVIEGAPAGGQLTLTTDVENYPGFPKGILGPELINRFRKQAERFGTRFITENVLNITKHKSGIIALKTNNSTINTRSVLIATGAQARWLNLESEQKFRGKGVSACATCDGFFFKGKIVGVVGGGDVAMEEALVLTKFAKKVYIIHRRDSFRASRIMQERVFNNKNIEIIWNAVVEEVLGDSQVTGVVLKKTNNTKQTLQLQGLFIAIGHKPATDFLKGSGVLVDKKGYVYTSERIAFESRSQQVPEDEFEFKYRHSTNVNGIFAAGDCVDYIYRQAVTASGMSVAAELEIEQWLESLGQSASNY